MTKEELTEFAADAFELLDKGVRRLTYFQNDMDVAATSGEVDFPILRDIANGVISEIEMTSDSLSKVKSDLSSSFSNVVDARSGRDNGKIKRGLDPAGDMAQDAAEMFDLFKNKFEALLLNSIKGESLSAGHVKTYVDLVGDLKELAEYYEELLPSVKAKGH